LLSVFHRRCHPGGIYTLLSALFVLPLFFVSFASMQTWWPKQCRHCHLTWRIGRYMRTPLSSIAHPSHVAGVSGSGRAAIDLPQRPTHKFAVRASRCGGKASLPLSYTGPLSGHPFPAAAAPKLLLYGGYSIIMCYIDVVKLRYCIKVNRPPPNSPFGVVAGPRVSTPPPLYTY
jgi:hypothetical protein